MLFMNMAEPLTGAPGAVLLYALIGVLVWPSEKVAGLLDARGARIMWASSGWSSPAFGSAPRAAARTRYPTSLKKAAPGWAG